MGALGDKVGGLNCEPQTGTFFACLVFGERAVNAHYLQEFACDQETVCARDVDVCACDQEAYACDHVRLALIRGKIGFWPALMRATICCCSVSGKGMARW